MNGVNATEALATIRLAQSRPDGVEALDVQRAIEVLIDNTRELYTRIAPSYEVIRNARPSDWDRPMINRMLNEVRARMESRWRHEPGKQWKLLDIGTGHGRDLLFFSQLPDVRPFGVENSAGFQDVVRRLETTRALPDGTLLPLDMRDLRGVEDQSFECVRDHATLHHLPLLRPGFGADRAVSEAHRVLRRGGIYYVLVKVGDTLELVDTGEGLGSRLFQFYKEDALQGLLRRNGFRILHLEERVEERPAGSVRWLFALSERT